KKQRPPVPPVKVAAQLKVGPNMPAQVDGTLTDTDPTDAQGRHYKLFGLQLEAGKTYRFYMKGKGINAFLRLEDEAGKKVREDEFGEVNDSGMMYKPEKSGVYRVVATTFDPKQKGSFQLTVT